MSNPFFAAAWVVACVAGWVYVLATLDRIERRQRRANRQGNRIMSIAQEILDAITEVRTAQDALSNTVTQLAGTADSIVTAVDALVAGSAITPEQAATILGSLRDDKAAVDSASASAAAANQKLADELAKITPANPGPTQ